MERKALFDNFKNEVKIALFNVIDKVDEVGRITSVKLKINSLKGKIKNCQTLIGEIAYQNQGRFSEFPEIVAYFEKIRRLEEEIEIREEEIAGIKKKEKMGKQ